MNSRRNFLKKSSMAGVLLLAIPRSIFAGSNNKAKYLKNLQPLRMHGFTETATAGDVNNIVFSRPSLATYFDSNGNLSYAGQNLLTYSQDFANSAWATGSDGIIRTTSAREIAPDGSMSTKILTETATNGQHLMNRAFTVKQGYAHTFSIYLKPGTDSKAVISLTNPLSYTGGIPSLDINLISGEITSVSNVISSSSTNVGNGWWRVSLTALPDLGTSSGVQILLMNDAGKTTYTGTKRNIFIWGAQFETAPKASAYTKTISEPYYAPRYNYDPLTRELNGLMVEKEATNLITYSDKISVWDKRASYIVASNVTAPDGLSKANKLNEGNSNITHYMSPKNIPSVTAGKTYTFSIFLKAGERDWAFFMVDGATVHFNLASGSVGGGTVNSAFIDTNVQNIDSGWFRCSVTCVATKSDMVIGIGPEISNGVKSYAGNGTSGIYVWGAQLEAGSVATSYIPTVSSAATRSDETCSILPPAGSSSNDVFVQRTNGGTWIDNVSEAYEVPHSTHEVQTGSFWSTGTSDVEKEGISENLYPFNYVNAGPSLTSLSVFNNSYRIQSASKAWSVNWAQNKTCMLYRFQVNPGDQWSSDIGKDKSRSEMYSSIKLPFNEDVWLSYAVRVLPGAPISSSFCHIGQFHATEDVGDAASVPVLTFRYLGENDLSITTCANVDKIAASNTKGIVRYTGKLERGVWVRNVLRIRFSATNGQLQWWENGVEKLNLSGVGIGNNDTQGPYWKFGIYKNGNGETVVAEYANMELSTTDSLRSRVNNPLLIV